MGGTIPRAKSTGFAICKTGTEAVTRLVQKFRKTAVLRPSLVTAFRFPASVALPVSAKATAEDAVIAGLHATVGVRRRHGQPQLQKLPHGCRAGRHPVLESKIVKCGQFLRREHDLQTFTTYVVHDCHPK